MNEEARVALGRVIQNFGAGICQTPRSCELMLRQECGMYPEESRLLVEALRHGVASEVMRYSPARPWTEFSGEMSKVLQTRAGLTEPEGSWAIESWAYALGCHPQVWESAPVVRAASERETVSMTTFKTAMATIVGAGGGFGGLLGTIVLPGVILITTASFAELPFMEGAGRGSKNDLWMFIALALLLLGAVGFVCGSVGSALGWLYGKGDRVPWTGFAAAFGGAFMASALGGYFCGVFGSAFGSFLGGFGAATTCARRGGYSR